MDKNFIDNEAWVNEIKILSQMLEIMLLKILAMS